MGVTTVAVDRFAFKSVSFGVEINITSKLCINNTKERQIGEKMRNIGLMYVPGRYVEKFDVNHLPEQDIRPPMKEVFEYHFCHRTWPCN